MPTKQLYCSIVIPVFNEAGSLRELTQRLIAVMLDLGRPYEIIFVNDGSKDNSAAILTQLYHEHPETLRVICFNANFGQHMAIMAGFERVRGEIVITMDADLQNPPEEIPKLLAAIEEGYDVVNAYRYKRQDNWCRLLISKWHNKLRVKMMPKLKMLDEGCMLRAYRRKIVDLVAATGEAVTFIPALALTYACNPTEIAVAHAPRHAGQSNYNLYSLIRYNFDLLTGFSLVPLQAITMCGVAVSVLSFLFVLFLGVRRLIIGPEVGGVFTLFAILFFLIGILLLGVGISGEYVGRIYQEVRQRPRFVISNILESDSITKVADA